MLLTRLLLLNIYDLPVNQLLKFKLGYKNATGMKIELNDCKNRRDWKCGSYFSLDLLRFKLPTCWRASRCCMWSKQKNWKIVWPQGRFWFFEGSCSSSGSRARTRADWELNQSWTKAEPDLSQSQNQRWTRAKTRSKTRAIARAEPGLEPELEPELKAGARTRTRTRTRTSAPAALHYQLNMNVKFDWQLYVVNFFKSTH